MKTVSIAVVGHGPGIMNAPFGEFIDSHDIVVRMKWHRHLVERPEYFGSRTDVVFSSLVVAPRLLREWPDVKNFGVFYDSRTYDMPKEKVAAIRELFTKANLFLDHDLCRFWDDRYLERLGESEGEPHTSTGFHVLPYLGKYFNPCTVTLFGFDSLASGEWTWSLTRGPDWDKYPKHRFDIENAMLPELETVYNMKIHIQRAEVR